MVPSSFSLRSFLLPLFSSSSSLFHLFASLSSQFISIISLLVSSSSPLFYSTFSLSCLVLSRGNPAQWVIHELLQGTDTKSPIKQYFSHLSLSISVYIYTYFSVFHLHSINFISSVFFCTYSTVSIFGRFLTRLTKPRTTLREPKNNQNSRTDTEHEKNERMKQGEYGVKKKEEKRKQLGIQNWEHKTNDTNRTDQSTVDPNCSSRSLISGLFRLSP